MSRKLILAAVFYALYLPIAFLGLNAGLGWAGQYVDIRASVSTSTLGLLVLGIIFGLPPFMLFLRKLVATVPDQDGRPNPLPRNQANAPRPIRLVEIAPLPKKDDPAGAETMAGASGGPGELFQTPSSPKRANIPDIADQIANLDRLRRSRILSPSEYESARHRLN